MKRIHITEAQLPIMQLVWQSGELGSSEILSRLGGNKSTIKTQLLRLVKSGALGKREQGRGYIYYIYYPLISEECYIKQERQSFLNSFFGGSAKEMLLNFMNDSLLTPEELRQIIDAAKEK